MNGPEKVYMFTNGGPGQIKVNIEGIQEGKNLHAFLLWGGAGCNQAALRLYISQGEATYQADAAGLYYLVVDGEGDANNSGSYTITATYPASSYTLTVQKTGKGGGSVISTSHSGINCGSDCTQEYSNGISVALSASPDALSTFTGWSGDVGSCTTGTTCTIAMDANKTATTTFDACVQNGEFNGATGWTSVGGTVTFNGQLSITGANGGSPLLVSATQTDVTGNQTLTFTLMSYTSSDTANRDYPVFRLGVTEYRLCTDGTVKTPNCGTVAAVSNANKVMSAKKFSVSLPAGTHMITFGVRTTDGTGGAGTAIFDMANCKGIGGAFNYLLWIK
jgi:hypothetical protein